MNKTRQVLSKPDVSRIFLDKIPRGSKQILFFRGVKTHARIKERTQNALCLRKRRRLFRRQRQKDARVASTLFPSWTLRAPRLKTGAINSFIYSPLSRSLGLNRGGFLIQLFEAKKENLWGRGRKTTFTHTHTYREREREREIHARERKQYDHAA